MANTLNKITTKSILDATVATADIADDAVMQLIHQLQEKQF